MKESDFENKSSKEIIDGLVNKFDGDEELALKELNKHIESMKDGYAERNPEVMTAKDKLEKMVESKHIFKLKEFSTNVGKSMSLVVNEALSKYKMLCETEAEDAWVDLARGNSKTDEVYSFIAAAVHPNCKYSKAPFRFIDNSGNKHVIQLMGIDNANKEGFDANKTQLYYKEVFYDRTDEGIPYLKRSEKRAMPVKQFYEIMHNGYNDAFLNEVIYKDSEEMGFPELWQDRAIKGDIELSNKTRKFLDSYKDELENLSLDTIRKLYDEVEIKGFPFNYGIQILKNTGEYKLKSDNKESVIAEATPPRNTERVEHYLEMWGLSPAMARKFSRQGYIYEVPGGKEIGLEPKEYEIIDINDGKVWVRNTEKGSRAEEITPNELVAMLSKEYNTKTDAPDIWYMAKDPKTWARRTATKNTGLYKKLTNIQIESILKEIQETNPRYKGLDLVALHNPSKTNRAVLTLLKEFDPEVNVRRSTTSYSIFVPYEGNTQADAPRHHGANPYQKLKNFG